MPVNSKPQDVKSDAMLLKPTQSLRIFLRLVFLYLDLRPLEFGVQSIDSDLQRRAVAPTRTAIKSGDYGYGFRHRKMVQRN
jgi:hypothetical protein